MIQNYNETFYSRLDSDIQEQFYLCFMDANPIEKMILFSKLKYGDEITFKDLSDKLNSSMVRSTYIKYVNIISGNINCAEYING